MSFADFAEETYEFFRFCGFCVLKGGGDDHGCNKGATLIRAPPIVWPKQRGPKMTKVPITPLMIVRFSIRNQHWKAQNLNFNSMLSYLSLSERRCPY